ncbi:hypothetical protein [Parvularcula marina]|jgi:hypothetical protein|uniref:hypothetical protein n=1 Tax=Parvularcula marina TaxID=2292771 RepID=UPI001313F1A5|nr:hypothetical protein [Parvularcula marina]
MSDNFTIYTAGFAVMLIGILGGAYLLGVPQAWLAVIGITLAGLGIMSAVRKTKRKES